MSINLNLFETFLVVAQELHFGRAARRLNRSQSPISRQISQLEHELGFELFRRSTQSVALTHAGQVLLKEIAPALEKVHQAVRLARRASQGEVGSLALGINPSIMFGVLPGLLEQFRARHPDITIKMHMRSKFEQLQALRNGSLDVALVRSLSQDAEFCYELLLSEPMVVAMGPKNPLGAKTEIQLSDLKGYGFITYTGQSQMSASDLILAACHQTGFAPRIVQETDDMQSAAAMAALDVGVTLIAASLHKLGLAGLVCRPVVAGNARLTVPLYAAYRRGIPEPPLSKFLEIARQVCRAWSPGSLPG